MYVIEIMIFSNIRRDIRNESNAETHIQGAPIFTAFLEIIHEFKLCR